MQQPIMARHFSFTRHVWKLQPTPITAHDMTLKCHLQIGGHLLLWIMEGVVYQKCTSIDCYVSWSSWPEDICHLLNVSTCSMAIGTQSQNCWYTRGWLYSSRIQRCVDHTPPNRGLEVRNVFMVNRNDCPVSNTKIKCATDNFETLNIPKR